MSLDRQALSFTKSVQAQAGFSQARRAVAAPTPTPPPAPTSTKRKRPVERPKPVAPPIVYSQPTDTSLMGQHILTQVHHAVQYLKGREVPQSPAQIAGYLSIQLTPTLLDILKRNERILYDPAVGTFEFKPIHNIRSSQSLLAFLQQQTTAQGLSVKELKDGWAAAVEVIADLEEQGEILVTRTKKDNQPRMVWINDKTLDVEVEDEFKTIWHKITIPPPAELPGELEKAGLKPTSIDPASIKKDKPSQNKGRKKPVNRRVKVSNTHMSSILKDSKDLRK
ncbi:transcription factor TFIIE beta subunit, TFIIEB, Tfa2 [Rhizina undulata]